MVTLSHIPVLLPERRIILLPSIFIRTASKGLRKLFCNRKNFNPFKAVNSTAFIASVLIEKNKTLKPFNRERTDVKY